MWNRTRRLAMAAGMMSLLVGGCVGRMPTEGNRADRASTTSPATDLKPEGPAVFTNPLKRDGADPWLGYVDGWYYLSTTTARDVVLRRARTLDELSKAKDVTVFDDDTPGRDHHIWAPEFHRLDNGAGEMRWYLYYTAAPRDHEPGHRMYVAESARDDINGPYTFKAKLLTDRDDKHYAIDGTVFDGPSGERYFAWCGRPSETGQGLFLSRMTNPWTLSGDRVGLKADGFGCPYVREGPVTLRRGGKIFMTYSMCDADKPDYRLGTLVADETADLMNPASWKQHPNVLFSRNDAAGVYGPGHHFFFKSPDGTEDWIIYHAKTTTKTTFGDRSTRAQKFTWNADGIPNFGTPVAEGVELAVPSAE